MQNIVPPSDFGVQRLASQSAVVIFSKTSCCMCYSVKAFFRELGVNPVVHELDQDPRGTDMERVLIRMGCNPAVPAVFVGGMLIGGTSDVMRLHLSGNLTSLLTRGGGSAL